MAEAESGVTEFETYRTLLLTIAYRMLGSAAEAEDLVQEAYLRFADTERSLVRDVKAFLVACNGEISSGVAGAALPDASRRDAGDAGHRRGATAKQMAARRLQPSGLVAVAARSLRHSSSTMPPHRLLLVP